MDMSSAAILGAASDRAGTGYFWPGLYEREHEARRQPGFAYGGASVAATLGQGEQEDRA